jgi:flagellar motor switch protein FliM
MGEARIPLKVRGSEVLARRDLVADREYQVYGYDFKRPDKFSRDQIRTLAMMHETFARLCSTTLTGMLRMPVAMSMASVDQLTFGEFSKSIPNPTLIGIVNMDPLRGSAILQMDPTISFAMLDRLFGGRGVAIPENRETTAVEVSVMEGLFIRLLGNLRESWSTVLDLRPKLSNIETEIAFSQIVPPNDMVVLVTLEVKLGEVRGMVNFCVPYITIESLIGRLSAKWLYSAIRKAGENFSKGTRLENLQHAPLPVELVRRTEPIPLPHLSGLERGSLIPLAQDGLIHLEAAEAALLTLRPGAKKDGPWEVLGNSGGEGLDALFQPEGSADRVDPMAGLKTRVEEPLAALRAELAELTKGMHAGMEKLRKSQEESKEQLHYWVMQKEEGVARPESHAEKPFQFLEALAEGGAEESIASFLAPELHQLIALVLSQLEGPSAAGVLSKLPAEYQTAVVERMATLERVTPEVNREVARVLQRKLSVVAQEGPRVGGLRDVVALLNHSPSEVEKRVVEALEKTNPALAESIKQRMFTFEDLLLLDDASLDELTRKVAREDLLKALKTVDDSFRQAFLPHLPPGDRASFEADFAKLGRLRLTEVEEAQQRIVNVVRLMEEQGQIRIARKDEKIV